MTTVEIPTTTERTWSPAIGPATAVSSAWRTRSSTSERLEQVLPAVRGVCLIVVDLALVLGSFMAAHWLRFIAADPALSALGIEQYLMMALTIGIVTSGLFAFRGLYDEPRPYAWPTRLYTIVSAVSTALVVALTLSYFRGDGAFSRLWSATGWLIAIGSLIAWRELATHAYTAIRERLAPATRALVVGANPLGKQLARDRKSVV